MSGEPERKGNNGCDPIQGKFLALAQKEREREINRQTDRQRERGKLREPQPGYQVLRLEPLPSEHKLEAAGQSIFWVLT
jgi:hypothetical protein